MYLCVCMRVYAVNGKYNVMRTHFMNSVVSEQSVQLVMNHTRVGADDCSFIRANLPGM